MPTMAGDWTLHTRCQPCIAGLDNEHASFACTPTPEDERNPFLRHGPLSVAPSGRHFVHRDGTPFFWLGDTVWNGPTLVKTAAEWARFLDHRAAQGFNAIQFVATQWRTAPTNPDGEIAYAGRDPIWINPHWFERIDARMDAIAARGLLAVPVLVWTLGRDDINPSTLSEREIVKLARYLVARYGAHPVAWILNGDGRYHGEAAEKWKRIGRAVFDLPGHAPVFQHPGGMQWPHDTFNDETWIDAIGYQSGHGDDAETLQWIHSGPPARKWSQRPARPQLNLEPPYEDHICYQSRKRHDAYTVRRAAWWSLLNAPPAGLTYGAHGVWSWEENAQPPADHFYTGVAQPWHVAMHLPGAEHMRHLAEFFRSGDFWALTPDPSLVRSAPRPPRHPGRLHLVFCRNLDGETKLWLDGREAARGFVGGDLSTWSDDTFLALGNESTGDYGWRGTFHRLAIYDRALTAAEIAAGNQTRDQPAAGALASYLFRPRAGTTIRDEARRSGTLPFEIATPEHVRWSRDGLTVDGDAVIRSAVPAQQLIAAIRRSQALTFELVLTPTEWDHRACGRILSLQIDRWNRNCAVSQVAVSFTGNVRTAATNGNAEPTLATPGGETAAMFVAAARSRDRRRAVLYLPVGGAVEIAAERLAKPVRAVWLDPRTGRRYPARRRSGGSYVAPDAQDWVLALGA